MTFIDFFAGVGGFRKGMENAGHKCVGFCEYDKYAVASYTAMHLITEKQREYLATLDLKRRQKEILKEEYRNGEWYAADIRRVYAGDIPKADIWCFGFPCQDISVAGNQQGFQGNRSSLFFRVMYLLGQLREEDRPHTLLIENVKNLFSVNGGWDFARLLTSLDGGGYDAEWCLLNSKNFGVPQNRERVFIVGHIRGRSFSKVFPLEGTDGTDSVDIRQIGKDGTSERNNPNQWRVYDSEGGGPCLTDCQGGGREPHIVVAGKLDPTRKGQSDVFDPDGISRALDCLCEKKKTIVPCDVEVMGGIGEMKSNCGTQFYQQDRIYDGTKCATAVSGNLPGGSNKYGIPVAEGVERERERERVGFDVTLAHGGKVTETAATIGATYYKGLRTNFPPNTTVMSFLPTKDIIQANEPSQTVSRQEKTEDSRQDLKKGL